MVQPAETRNQFVPGPQIEMVRVVEDQPESRADDKRRETVDRDVRSSRAIASMVRSCK